MSIMYILVLKNMLKLLEKIINIEKSQTGGKKSNTPTPIYYSKSCLGGTQLTHSSVVKGIMTSEPRKDHPQVLGERLWLPSWHMELRFTWVQSEFTAFHSMSISISSSRSSHVFVALPKLPPTPSNHIFRHAVWSG